MSGIGCKVQRGVTLVRRGQGARIVSSLHLAALRPSCLGNAMHNLKIAHGTSFHWTYRLLFPMLLVLITPSVLDLEPCKFDSLSLWCMEGNQTSHVALNVLSLQAHARKLRNDTSFFASRDKANLSARAVFFFYIDILCSSRPF
jgi:hypothetical protein